MCRSVCPPPISTAVLVVALLVARPLLRLATRAALARTGAGRDLESADVPDREAWGWSTGNWLGKAAALAAVVVVLWLPPLVQQLSTCPGNLVQVYRFLSTHHAITSWRVRLRALNTLFGSFPFRTDEAPFAEIPAQLGSCPTQALTTPGSWPISLAPS